MTDPRGSNWRKWDLHVHSPLSHVQHYGSHDSNEAWEKFITDIENLQPEFKVIGINDYNFIDGYEKTLEFKARGRLSNIDLILPVVEFRVDKFVGTDNWREINFHVVFSNELSPDEIKSQFLNGIQSKHVLSPEYEGSGIKWDGIHTRASYEELGKAIHESVPDDQKPFFTDFVHVGFSNLVCPLENIEELLAKDRFHNRTITALGVAEWGQMKWTPQSIASKKSYINGVDFSFTASETIAAYDKSREKLRKAGVNTRIIHSSDAHYLSDQVKNINRIGHSFTWIKANPTFDGLRHALLEFDERVFVGVVPEKITSVTNNPTKYIQSIEIRKRSDAKTSDKWFENVGKIPLNTGLVSIIGNQGSGKSALTDIIGLTGDSHNQDNFSFLNDHAFCDKRQHLAESYEATLTFHSEDSNSHKLNDRISNTSAELVRYIPQRFFDRICDNIQTKGNEFEKRLHEAIFSHIPVSDRHDCLSLDELRDFKTAEIERAKSFIKDEIHDLNSEIIQTEVKLRPEYRQSLDNKLVAKNRELDAHRQRKPTTVSKPSVSDGLSETIGKKKERIQELEAKSVNATALLKAASDKLANLEKAKLQVEEISNYIETARKRFSKLNVSLQFEDIVSVQIKFDKLDKLLETARAEKKRVSENAKKFPSQIEKLNAELTELTDQLNQPARQYEKYTKDLQKWKTKEKVIIGDASTPDSLKFVEAAISEIDTFPVELSRLKRQRREKALLIHSKIENLAQEFQVLYGAVQNFINNDPLAKKLEITFSVSIVENNFTNTFLDNIDLSRKSIFFRRGGGLDEIVPSIDFNKSEDVKMFLDNVTALLGKVDDLDDIAKTSVIEIYDYLFSLQFLEPRFVLKLFGKGIEQLSSGQRGSLLMIFHLIIDKDDRPLIVDQPEGNLDGQYIYETLVAAIRRAKRNRQVIIVTHNPNLAVCCDSEQIIHASLDREDGNSVSYECGAIEDSRQKQVVVDKLEGTMPGFDNRKVKYAFGLR